MSIGGRRRAKRQLTKARVGFIALATGLPPARTPRCCSESATGWAHKRESIDAHLTIVFATLGHRIHRGPHGWSIRKFVRTVRRYRTLEIRASQHILTAEDPLLPDLREVLALIIKCPDGAH